MADEVLCEVEDGVAIITLNRPERLNAFTLEVGRAYDRCLVDLAKDPQVRAIVITGAGKGFCGGADASRLASIADDHSALADHEKSAYEELTSAPEHLRRRYMAAGAMPQPVIAAINGACAGAGLALAISCDVRFASSSAVFSAIFARRGLVAESALAWTLSKLIGRSAASDMLLSGRRIDATTALRFGLVSEVLAPESLMDHALGYARDIAANVSPRSARIIKSQLHNAQSMTLIEALTASDVEMREALASADFQEGIAALRDKRQPRFAVDNG